MSQKLIDEIGNRYGLLTVIELTKDKNNRTAWLCRCDCGNTKIVRGPDLRTGKITTCGNKCPLKNTRSSIFIDETGNKYGRLTVLYRSNIDSKKVIWHCLCDCGKESDVQGSDLRSGKVISCGCYSRENASERNFKNEIGNRYGKLTVISLVTKHPKAIWHCKCDCGRYVDVRGIDLRNGNTKSCGCIKSWYEEEIDAILTQLRINFKREYSFDDFISDKGKKFRYDFAILNSNNEPIGLIEYNGIQHYEPIESWGGIENLKTTQEHDNLKKQYAKNHNIPLLILNKNNKNLETDIQIFLEDIE